MVSSKLLGLSNLVPFLVPQKVEHPACQSPLSAIRPAVPFNSQYGSKDVASSVSLFPATSVPYENEDIGVLTVTHSRPAPGPAPSMVGPGVGSLSSRPLSISKYVIWTKTRSIG